MFPLNSGNTKVASFHSFLNRCPGYRDKGVKLSSLFSQIPFYVIDRAWFQHGLQHGFMWPEPEGSPFCLALSGKGTGGPWHLSHLLSLPCQQGEVRWLVWSSVPCWLSKATQQASLHLGDVHCTGDSAKEPRGSTEFSNFWSERSLLLRQG